MAMKGLSIQTELANIHIEAMVLEATRYLGTVPFFRVRIPPGEGKDVCYGDLHIDANPDRPVSMSVFLEGAAEEEKYMIPPILIRDSTKLILNFENGKVTVVPVEGNILARIGCVVKLRRTLLEIGENIGKNKP